jgi:uncharacterized membrane protein
MIDYIVFVNSNNNTHYMIIMFAFITFIIVMYGILFPFFAKQVNNNKKDAYKSLT